MTTEAEFVEIAHPHSWLLVADNLHAQAVALNGARGHSFTGRLDAKGAVQGRWDTTNRSVFLLGGFALENCIKGFLVYENPQWISNGRLSKQLRSHSLTELASKAHNLPYPQRGRWVLEAFEDGLESWARYPCGLTAATPGEEGILTERLWSGYLRLMRAYGRRLQGMLKRTWRGPHGFEGHFKFSGQFFDTE